MRRLLIGLVATAATTLLPIWAMAGNQEVAEQIAASLRSSGKLQGYKVGVKYQDGTAWLRGTVSTQQQLQATLSMVASTPGVTRVVNGLTVSPTSQPAAASPTHGSVPESVRPRPLQQAVGAIAAEHVRRPVTADLPAATARTTDASRRLEEVTRNKVRMVPQAGGQADPVPASFSPQPAQQAAATAGAPRAMTPAPQVALQPLPPQAPTAQPGMRPMGSMPVPVAYMQQGQAVPAGEGMGQPVPQYIAPVGGGVTPARYDEPHLPSYAWPSYATYPNYAGLTYPKQYSPTAWPYIGPFYPYPQVPLGWRKVTLEWHDGWWQLDFDDGHSRGPLGKLFRPPRKSW